MELPLLEYATTMWPPKNPSKYTVLACQHFLKGNYQMLEKIVDAGFDPKKMHVLSKCYSYNSEIDKSVRRLGASTYNHSYDSHQAFDIIFSEHVEKTIDRILKSESHDKIMILDDGATVINYFIKKGISEGIFAIEQTSSGYHKVKDKNPQFPVMNIARSRAKLEVESPYIADLVVDRAYKYIIKGQRILVIGAGAIGRSISKKIKEDGKFKVELYDNDSDLSDYKTLEEALALNEVIIGSAGSTSISNQYHSLLKDKTLINAASTDAEFDAVHLRRKIKKNNNPHKDMIIDEVNLVNSGFPITFYGNTIEVNPEYMQLTHSLMLAGAFILTREEHPPGIIELKSHIQENLIKEFATII